LFHSAKMRLKCQLTNNKNHTLEFLPNSALAKVLEFFW